MDTALSNYLKYFSCLTEDFHNMLDSYGWEEEEGHEVVPWRKGSRSLSRSASWARMIATGSRSGANSSVPCSLRGATWRAARPNAVRSATLTQGRGFQLFEGRLSRVQAASSSAGVGIAGFVARRRPLAADRVVVMAPTLAGVHSATTSG